MAEIVSQRVTAVLDGEARVTTEFETGVLPPAQVSVELDVRAKR